MVKNYGEINAVEDNSIISNENQYLTYNVHKNGRYIFKATNENGKTTETAVEVKNIEKFELIDNLELTYVNNEQKAYNYKGAAVPKGYYVDTNTKVNTGLVITDSIDNEGYSTGNEFVWVPVDVTNKNGENDYYIEVAETGVRLKAGVSTEVKYTKYSKLYSFSNGNTRDEYGTFYPIGNTTTSGFGTPNNPTEHTEPAILTSTTYGENKYYSSINIRGTKNPMTSEVNVAKQYINDYNSMVDSVNKYKGFYIGRYEITKDEAGNATEKAGVALSGEYDWYSLYNECMTFGKTNTESSMIYGNLWDQTMYWLAKSGYDVGYTGKSSHGFGNHYNEEVSIKDGKTKIVIKPSETEKKLETGQTSYTRSNNIFDLSGNCGDWTQEGKGTSSRIRRGGGYYSSAKAADRNMASCRMTYWPNAKTESFSTRPQLYIK